MTFLEESKEWLAVYDYSLYATSRDMYIFSSNKVGENYPEIVCFQDNGIKYCELRQTSGYKLWLCLKSGRLQYKHPDLSRIIAAMKHYAEIAELYLPKL